MSKHIWILGSSGFAFDIANRFIKIPGPGNYFMGFLDDRKESRQQFKSILRDNGMPYEVISPDELDCTDQKNRFLLGAGDPIFKSEFVGKYNISYEQIHDFRIDVDFAEVALINSGIYFECKISGLSKIGVGNFVDSHSIIGHECIIGDFNHIGVNVIIGGNSTIGNRNNIHSGAIIGNNITIGDDCVIGSGSIVLRDLPSGSKLVAPKSIKIS